jgi:hypothetical protein
LCGRSFFITSGFAGVSSAQEFMIKEKKGILKPTGFGSRCRLAIPEGEHPEMEAPGQKNNLNRQPNKQMRELSNMGSPRIGGRRRDWSQIHKVDLLMGNFSSLRRGNASGVFEELERKGWFFAKQKMRPYDEKHKANTAFSRVCQALFTDPTARRKARWRYAGAERIRLCQKSLLLPYIVLFYLLCSIIQLYIAVEFRFFEFLHSLAYKPTGGRSA